jgi:hypothetical protein
MRTLCRTVLAVAALGLAFAAPASADEWHRNHHHKHGWWGGHRGPPAVVYAPPPVIYAPPPAYYVPPPAVVYAPPQPSPLATFIIPLTIR